MAASALQLLVGARVDVALDPLVGVVVGVLLLPCGSGLFIHTFSNSNFAAEWANSRKLVSAPLDLKCLYRGPQHVAMAYTNLHSSDSSSRSLNALNLRWMSPCTCSTAARASLLNCLEKVSITECLRLELFVKHSAWHSGRRLLSEPLGPFVHQRLINDSTEGRVGHFDPCIINFGCFPA